MNKSVSEDSFEGTIAKISAQEAKAPSASDSNPQVDLIDNGKSWLKIAHSNPFFDTDWRNFTSHIVSKMNGNTDSWEIQILSAHSNGEQKLTILFPKFFATTKFWKSENLDSINYLERKTNVGRNAFVSYPDIYKENSHLRGGAFELIKETEAQMIFKVLNLKIKRVAKNNFVEITGFIYSDKKN